MDPVLKTVEAVELSKMPKGVEHDLEGLFKKLPQNINPEMRKMGGPTEETDL